MSQNNTTMNQVEMQAMIDKLQAENAALKASKPSGGLKVSEKGAVSVYGLQRFPVTLYAPAWEKLLAKADEIRAFIETHKAELSFSKGDKVVEDKVNVA